MDRFDAMRVFARVVERRSYTRTAQDLNLPRVTVTDTVERLEAMLGTRLLRRTTRHLAPTSEGEAYYRRCVGIISEIEDADSTFASAKPRGLIRVEAQGTLARHLILPTLPGFFAEYPDVEIALDDGDKRLDPIREGADFVLRFGNLPESEAVARRSAQLPRVTCASPAYLERFGYPSDPDRLEGHRMVGLRSPVSGNIRALEFMTADGVRKRMLGTPVSVSGKESYLAAGRHGFGLVQLPHLVAEADLERGALIEVLPTTLPPASPVTLLHRRSSHLSPRLRVFLDWTSRRLATLARPATLDDE